MQGKVVLVTGAVASLITWLASDAGKDINGAVIPVYGSDV